jgi:hypothetical protein
MAMEIEERVTKIEALIAEGEGVNRWERRILRWFKFLLRLLLSLSGRRQSLPPTSLTAGSTSAMHSVGKNPAAVRLERTFQFAPGQDI